MMSPDRRDDGHRWRIWCWALSLLALLSLAACGASERGTGAPQPDLAQPTAGATQPATALPSRDIPPTARPTSPPTISVALTLPPTRPTIGPRPSPTRQPARPLKPTATPLAAPTVPPNPTAPAAGAWQTYRNPQAGYRIDYPPNWAASELLDEAGASITTFMPASGGPGISVTVQVGGPPATEPSEHETRRCESVVVARLTGTRCFDTVASTTSTTLAGKGRTHVIATTGAGVDDGLYQRMLDSFAPLG